MKKTYIKPISETIALPNLMQTLHVSGGGGSGHTSGGNGGWSKKFWGDSMFEDEDEEETDSDF